MISLTQTNFNFPNQVSKYSGKVREVYKCKNDILVMVSTDRLSAFDVVLPKGIPYKGQILNQIACKMLGATSHIVPNWLISSPDPNVSIGQACEPFKVEMLLEDICQDMLQDFINLVKEKFVELKCRRE
jgi:phosphoribosylaminoimidazole-succinocarboxamide synthase